MNDKCSVGTGRFLEVMVSIPGKPIDESGGLLHFKSLDSVKISSTRTVFAESEVIFHVCPFIIIKTDDGMVG